MALPKMFISCKQTARGSWLRQAFLSWLDKRRWIPKKSQDVRETQKIATREWILLLQLTAYSNYQALRRSILMVLVQPCRDQDVSIYFDFWHWLRETSSIMAAIIRFYYHAIRIDEATMVWIYSTMNYCEWQNPRLVKAQRSGSVGVASSFSMLLLTSYGPHPLIVVPSNEHTKAQDWG